MKTNSSCPVDAVANETSGGHHVYILPTHDRSRAKIGRTRNGKPLHRIATLACTYPDIDLAGAVIIEVDTHKIEQILHIAFGPRRDRQSHRRDGFSEWFLGDNIVDEAIAFVQTVATHRGTEYRVIRNIEALIHEHRARNPQIGVRAARPTEAERDQRARAAEDELRRGVLAGAQAAIDHLRDRRFDAIVTNDDNRYLSRTVQREVEPECWSSESRHRVSDWGKALIALADVRLTVDGGNGRWRLLDLPAFKAVDTNHGREYYRIPDSTHCSAHEDRPDSMLDHAAWAALERALAHLPVMESDCDPTRYHSSNLTDAD